MCDLLQLNQRVYMLKRSFVRARAQDKQDKPDPSDQPCKSVQWPVYVWQCVHVTALRFIQSVSCTAVELNGDWSVVERSSGRSAALAACEHDRVHSERRW